MDIRPIRNEADYDAALREIDALFDSQPGTPEEERLEVLTTLVEAHEARHYRIPPPDPIEAIEFEMERRGLAPKDLEPHIGARSRVWEVLHRKRPLTLLMIRRLGAGLGIPMSILAAEYALDDADRGPVHENETGSSTYSGHRGRLVHARGRLQALRG